MNDVFLRFASCGCTIDQALKATELFMSITPPLSELDILLINANPSLSNRSKRKLTKQIRKCIEERERQHEADD